MFKKLFILFKIARKLALSDALKVISKQHQPPFIIKILLNLFSISFSKSNYQTNKLTEEEKLCSSIQEMGTTFIKLGQFLSTRPDIIGENLSLHLEKLQDRLPPFSTHEAKEIIKKNLGNEIFDSLINFGEPIAAASIAQVHKAQINDNGTIKDVAIKILRPNIKKTFNDEIDALMLLAYLIESLIGKTKRLRLVEVVFLLKEITNHEMDLRFEAAAANEFYENTKNDSGFYVPKIYWNFTSEEILTLDWIDGISIREKEILENKKIDIKNISTNIIQHFLRHAVREGFLVPKEVPIDDLAQALRSIGEPIFGQAVKDISGGKLLKQLFDVTEKFNMQTQPQLLMLQKTMVVVEGVARKLNPNTNIWTTSKPVLENWLKETKDPMTKINETLQNTSEVIKRLPEFPEIMDKANQALTYLASGQIPQNSNSYTALNTQKSEMIAFRNQSIIGLLLLVIFGLIVF